MPRSACLALVIVLAWTATAGGDESGPLKEARAKKAARKFDEALLLYERALKAAPDNVKLYLEAARCAMTAEDYEKAESLVKRGLGMTKKAALKDSDPTTKAFRDLAAEAARERELRDEFVPEFVEHMIKKLPRHKAIFHKKYVVAGQRRDGMQRYRLRAEFTGRHFRIDNLSLRVDNGIVLSETSELHQSEDRANERFEAIRDLIRKQMKRWTKRVRGATKSTKRAFAETGDDWEPHLEAPWWVVRRIVYGDGMDERYAAKITIRQPVAEGKEKPEPSERYQVFLQLRSSFFLVRGR